MFLFFTAPSWKRVEMVCSILLFCSLVKAQGDSGYSFFVAGHTYAWQGLNLDFKGKFPYINSRPEIEFGVFTGDMVPHNATSDHWDEVDADVALLNEPVYFAVGNHDMEDRTLYESRYGQTYYEFSYNNDLFIILDPNLDSWNISGDQYIFLDQTLDSLAAERERIFVFFHQLLWWQPFNGFSSVLPNSTAGRDEDHNFWDDVEPLFHNLSNEVVMFAGDVGAGSWSSDYMYHNYDNITFVASGMGEGVGDNFVIVNIDSSKNASYELICLSDPDMDCMGELEDFALDSQAGLSKSEFEIYPNPVSDVVNLNFPHHDTWEVRCVNLSGQVLEGYEVRGDQFSMALAQYPIGVYLIEVISGNGVWNSKIVVE